MRSETKKEEGVGGEKKERGTAEKAMLIIMREMRDQTSARAVWSAYSLLRIIARKLDGTDGETEGRLERASSRSDAIVVPQHFLSTATVFVCPVSTATANT